MPSPSLRGVLLPVPPAGDATTPVRARDVFALLTKLHPGRSWLTRLENLYIAVISVAVLLGATWTVARQAGSLFADVAGFYEFLWGTPLVVLIYLGVLRYSTVQGFVSFSEPDCMYLLPAPLRRRDLVRSRLLSAAVLLGIAGAVAGILIVVTSSGSHSGAQIGQGALAGLALGVLLIATSWHVQRLRWATALVMRLTLPLFGLAVLLAFLQTGSQTAKLAALWSGPWGWGILPLVSDAPPYGIAALGALCVLALAAAVSLYRAAGSWTLESFRVRARTRSQVVASLYALDYRSIGQAARGDKAQTWQSRIRLRPPARPALIVPWHGALALLRSPVRLGWGVVLAGAGMYLLALQPLRMGALFAGAAALYLSASSLLEPLRQEVDTQGAAKVLLPWPLEKVMWLHCLLPAAIMVGAALLSLAGGLALGFLGGKAVASLAIITMPLTFVVLMCAALSARRGGRVSSNVVSLAAMDTMGFSAVLVVLQLAIWAIIALAATVLAAWVLGRPESEFGFGFELAAVFAVLSVAGVAMQRGVAAKLTNKDFWERMTDAQGTSGRS